MDPNWCPTADSIIPRQSHEEIVKKRHVYTWWEPHGKDKSEEHYTEEQPGW